MEIRASTVVESTGERDMPTVLNTLSEVSLL